MTTPATMPPWRWLIALLLSLAVSIAAAAAQPAEPAGEAAAIVEPGRTLLVGIKPAPPFVIDEGDDYSGLAAELWQETAREHGWEFRYRQYDLAGLLDAVARGEVDVGVGAITTTAQREQRMDFSHPLTSSGLGIAVRSEWSAGWVAVVRALFSVAFLKVIGVLALVLLGVGVLAWLLERRHNPDQFGGGRATGVFAGVWWAMVTMTTVGYGDLAPRTVSGRLLGMAWMLTALIIVSFFTASITSALTVGQLSSRIRGAEDLAGMRIGSIAGSTSAQWLQSQALDYRNADNLDQALQQLADGKLDAVVYDAPLLHWKIKQEHDGQLQVLPTTLERQDYAFALPDDSPLREQIDTSLLRRINSPDWQQRVSDYFGGG